MDVIQMRIDSLEWMRVRANEWKKRMKADGEWRDAHERALRIHLGFIETEIEEIMMAGDEI